MNQMEKILLAPYTHILQIPGKGIRGKLLVAFGEWLKLPEETVSVISDVVQMLHNASLIIDDIEDNSNLRRGIPAAHSMYGIPQALNTANYVYFLALEKLFTLGRIEETCKVFTEHLLELHRGQGMDIYWRDMCVCPTEEEYREAVIKKTGGLFSLGFHLMQVFSDNKNNFKPLQNMIGVFFQIRDDFCNLWSQEYEATKGYCEDLTEGKFSFPLVHAIQTNRDDDQVLNILKQKTTDNDLKRYCVKLLEKGGSYDYTVQVLVNLEKDITSEIARLGGNAFLTALVAQLKKAYTQSAQSS